MSRLIVAIALLAFSVVPCIADESENLRIVAAMTEAINQRDFDALDALVSADVVRHSAATPDVHVSNLDEFKAFLRADLAACPDAKQKIDIMFGSGDKVAVRAFYIGTQTGAMGPFPPSGKKLELPFMGILRIEDGKIAEIWVEWDNMSALTQLGHFPDPEEGKKE